VETPPHARGAQAAGARNRGTEDAAGSSTETRIAPIASEHDPRDRLQLLPGSSTPLTAI
jgi:hypothetical protein